ncbi:hypothetical protein RJT34_01264 [Clitoria ternatea]|uniref:Uncharacterized protein n=1 Tax=Clitoria ternatea TaxID=43366 RepID=A0AAN9Q0G1_CLITE
MAQRRRHELHGKDTETALAVAFDGGDSVDSGNCVPGEAFVLSVVDANKAVQDLWRQGRYNMQESSKGPCARNSNFEVASTGSQAGLMQDMVHRAPDLATPVMDPVPERVSHPSRANPGAAGSPSRFALSGHQGNPMNLPSVSVSGTSYIASSPSPAASGGSSVFRDARQPSPWK